MWWLKCIGSLCVLAGCGYLGWHQGMKFRRRIAVLREVNQSLILFKSLTGTYRMPLYRVFLRISEQTGGPISEFYRKLSVNFERQEEPAGERLWQQTLADMRHVFESEDETLIAGLGNFIGIQDMILQAGAVEDCMREIQERIRRLEREKPEKEKLYHVVSLTIGSFLVILLF